jgi:hypothetical protein
VAGELVGSTLARAVFRTALHCQAGKLCRQMYANSGESGRQRPSENSFDLNY